MKLDTPEESQIGEAITSQVVPWLCRLKEKSAMRWRNPSQLARVARAPWTGSVSVRR
jgi:hypothetical protein